MDDLKTCLMAADRRTLLRFLGQLINHLTIVARASYEAADSRSRLVEVNETIHRVAGHLRDLLDESEAMTESRATAVVDHAHLLSPSELERLRTWSRI